MQAGNVEVVVEASYYSDGYHRHLDIFPALLLAPVGCTGCLGRWGIGAATSALALLTWEVLLLPLHSLPPGGTVAPPGTNAHPCTKQLSTRSKYLLRCGGHRPQAGNDSGAFPTASSYAYKLALDAQNVTRRLTLCPSQLREAQWKVGEWAGWGCLWGDRKAGGTGADPVDVKRHGWPGAWRVALQLGLLQGCAATGGVVRSGWKGELTITCRPWPAPPQLAVYNPMRVNSIAYNRELRAGRVFLGVMVAMLCVGMGVGIIYWHVGAG